MGLSNASAHRVITLEQCSKKIWARWVPWILGAKQKAERLGLLQNYSVNLNVMGLNTSLTENDIFIAIWNSSEQSKMVWMDQKRERHDSSSKFELQKGFSSGLFWLMSFPLPKITMTNDLS